MNYFIIISNLECNQLKTKKIEVNLNFQLKKSNLIFFSLDKFCLLCWCTDYNFAIKCGGPQITSSDQIVFERENATLGPATYYVTDTSRWAVSNVGLFSGSNNPQYTSTSSSQFTNTLDSELFQTTRISAGSLRYYGLGLENGNYTLTLQFAEIAIVNSISWQSLGRRVFDVYIQVSIEICASARKCVLTILLNSSFRVTNIVSILLVVEYNSSPL